MTPGRRNLRFETFDDVMPDVERLLLGHTTVGHWSLAQICRHLSTVMRRIVDLPASTPSDPSQWFPEQKKRQVFESRQIPEGLPAPPEIVPSETLGDREEADALRATLDYYRASPGPVVPHRFFGPLTRDEWDQLQLVHFAHHLSFAVPKSG